MEAIAKQEFDGTLAKPLINERAQELVRAEFKAGVIDAMQVHTNVITALKVEFPQQADRIESSEVLAQDISREIGRVRKTVLDYRILC